MRNKAPGEEAVFARIYLRRFSYPFTRILARTNATPNQITIGFLLLMMGGAVAQVEQGLRWVSIAGAAALQLGLILDAVDGEIARIKKIYSIKGVYLDMIGHRLVHGLLFSCTALGMFLRDGDVTWILLGMAATYGELGLTLMLYAKWRVLLDYPDIAIDEIKKVRDTPQELKRRLKAGFQETNTRPNVFVRAFRVWFGIDYVGALLLTALVLACVDRMGWLLWIYGPLQLGRVALMFARRVVMPFDPERPEARPRPGKHDVH